MKKSLSLLVAIAMVFSMFATLVSADTKSAGEQLKDAGLITGTNEGLEEGSEWLRQDVTVLIARLLGKVSEAEAHANTHGFEDLDSKFYNGYVSWAKENELFIGKSETKFGVGESITNQEFATVLLRVFKALEGKDEEVDYATAFETAVELGLANKDLDPKANAIRGDIYTSLVSAIEYKIDGKKVGTILGLKGYEVTNVEVVGAKATNSKTVVVEFNQDLSDVVASNFSVSKKENESVEVISSVATSGNTATLSLVDSLANNTEYVVTVNGVVSKDASATQAEEATAEFTFVKSEPASVGFESTTVAYGKDVVYVVKDAAGNDVTVDVPSDNIFVFSTNQSVVKIDGKKLVAESLLDNKTDYSVVQVEVKIEKDGEETKTIATEPTVITVQPTVAIVNGITKLSFNSDFEKAAEATLSVEDDKELFAQVKDASGNEIAAKDIQFTAKSANPTIAVATVGEKNVEGETVPQIKVFGVKTGSATIQVTAKFNGKTVSQSVVVTVQDKPKFTSVDTDKTSTKLVFDIAQPITEKVKLTLKDQFGKDFPSNEDKIVKVKASRTNTVKIAVVDADGNVGSTTDLVNANQQYDIATIAADASSITFELDLISTVDAASTVTLTFTVGSVTKNVTVNVVKGGALAGYVAEISATTIDVNPARNDKDVTVLGEVYKKDKNAINDKEATVSVYAKDANGNKIKIVNAGSSATDFKLVPEKGEFVQISGNKIQVKEGNTKAGSEKVFVTVNDLRIATFTVKVENTIAVLDKANQVKNAVTVDFNSNGASLQKELFGTKEDGNAFVGYNQYGDKQVIKMSDAKFYSSNQSVVDNYGNVQGNGTAQVTVLIKDKAFTITVVIKNFDL